MKKLIMMVLLYVNIFAANQAGTPAKNFELPNLYELDKTISFESYKGKVVLLNLWASWCNGCQEEMPLFVMLQNEYKNKKFKLLLSSIDKVPQNSIDFLKSVDAKRVLECVYDEQKSLAKFYKAAGMPSSYLIDKKGNVVAVFTGSIDEEKLLLLKSQINTLLEQ